MSVDKCHLQIKIIESFLSTLLTQREIPDISLNISTKDNRKSTFLKENFGMQTEIVLYDQPNLNIADNKQTST